MPVLILVVFVFVGCVSDKLYQNCLLPDGLQDAHPVIRDDYLLEIDQERVQLTKDYLSIHNPAFAATLPQENTADSIRFQPRMVVVHYTAIPSLQETMDYFQSNVIEGSREVIVRNGKVNVGIQFVVDQDGVIYRSYPETVISRHTIGLNHVAIGIENIGTGDIGQEDAQLPLTQAQLDSNAALIRHLASKYPTIEFVIGHQEYRDVENSEHPANDLFYEEFPAYRTEKSDPGDRFLRGLREALKSQPPR